MVKERKARTSTKHRLQWQVWKHPPEDQFICLILSLANDCLFIDKPSPMAVLRWLMKPAWGSSLFILLCKVLIRDYKILLRTAETNTSPVCRTAKIVAVLVRSSRDVQDPPPILTHPHVRPSFRGWLAPPSPALWEPLKLAMWLALHAMIGPDSM